MEDGKVRVLLVDDSETFCSVMEMAFSDSDQFDFTSVDSGRAALEKMKRTKFDVVILDHYMPEMSGLNVLQWINEQKLDVAAVMLTAEGSSELAVEAMKLGAYDYLRKDQIDIDHLPITIHAVHEQHLFRLDRKQKEKVRQ